MKEKVKKENRNDFNLMNENEEVETLIEEFEEAKGSVYRQAMNEKAIISFTLGILSIVFIWLFTYAAPVLGIVGIVFAVQARKEMKKTPVVGNGLATVGLVCAIVGLAVSAIKMMLFLFN